MLDLILNQTFFDEPGVLTPIIREYLTLDEMLRYCLLSDKDFYKEGSFKLTETDILKFRNALQAPIQDILNQLADAEVPLRREPGDAPYQILKRTIDALQAEKEVVLKQLELNSMYSMALQRYELGQIKPDSPENIIRLNKYLDDINMARALPKLPEPGGYGYNIHLMNLGLTRIPEALMKRLHGHKDLKRLILRGNMLSTLPASFGNLNLKELDLNNNWLITLPESFGNLKMLEKLDLNCNYFTTLPEPIRDVLVRTRTNWCLKFIAAPVTKPVVINPVVEKPVVTNPVVTNSHSSTASSLSNSTTSPSSLSSSVQVPFKKESKGDAELLLTQTVDAAIEKSTMLKNNKLTKDQRLELMAIEPNSPENISRLNKRLDEINMALALPGLPELGDQFKFQINLEGRGLTRLPEELITRLQGHTNLRYLYLGNNELTSVPASFGNLSTLKEVHLANNNLTTLPGSFSKLNKLNKLYLASNRFINLPESIRGILAQTQNDHFLRIISAPVVTKPVIVNPVVTKPVVTNPVVTNTVVTSSHSSSASSLSNATTSSSSLSSAQIPLKRESDASYLILKRTIELQAENEAIKGATLENNKVLTKEQRLLNAQIRNFRLYNNFNALPESSRNILAQTDNQQLLPLIFTPVATNSHSSSASSLSNSTTSPSSLSSSVQVPFKKESKEDAEFLIARKWADIIIEKRAMLENAKLTEEQRLKLKALKPNSLENISRLDDMLDDINMAFALPGLPEPGDKKVTMIVLKQRGLTRLPERLIARLQGYTGLTNLGLWDNKLTSLPESIGNLSSLKAVNLNRNKLTTLPESLSKLNQLKELYLDGNPLISLPESMRGTLAQTENNDYYLHLIREPVVPSSGLVYRILDV